MIFLIEVVATLVILVIFITFFVAPTRRIFIVRPVFNSLRKKKSQISGMEKQALKAGNAGFEKGLFRGYPDWDVLRSFPKLDLSIDEQKLMNGPVEELCRMTNDWHIRYKTHAIPDALWEFVMKHKLFGLRVPKERGGYAVSFQAQSLILGTIASRSVDVATMVELPTSLWPDEIIEKYGTEKQKSYYMPRLADSQEIVSFAITGITNGSDATAMRDSGIVEYGNYEGKKVLGVRLNWKKRYITFAPKATLLVLGFQLFDPNNLLKKNKDTGITLALIPSNHPGIKIGRRHLPSNLAFPHGPILGEDVFIPIEWVIGGEERVGQGWKMIMECLFVGRALALPSISVAAVKLSLRYSAAYARIRRQFGSPIGTFEGIEEPLTRLVETAYLTESARSLTAMLVDAGYRPLAVSALMKYRTTQYAREAVNDAMDIHAGRAVCDGPSNYLMSAFLAGPIGVTVEGANIVTRSIITFAQGILQTHPYFYKELESCEEPEENKAFEKFEKLFVAHIGFLAKNIGRSLFHNLTNSKFSHGPNKVPPKVKNWYKQLWTKSATFASMADITVMLMGGHLKKKQKLGGRLADALSELYMLSSILKRFEDDGFPLSDYKIVELCMTNGLYRFESAISEAIRNYPIVWLRPFLNFMSFPYGHRARRANDKLGHEVTQSILVPGPILDRLTRYIYINEDPEDITGRMEVAFKKSVEAESSQKKLDTAIRKDLIKSVYGVDWISEAEKQKIITEKEGEELRELEPFIEKALAVDHFHSNELSGE